MTQATLFDQPRPSFEVVPASRRADPATSREAAAKMSRSGKATAHAAIVLQAVEQNPGATYNELAEPCGLSENEVWRRLNDLLKAKPPLVKKGEVRPSFVNGNKMATWWAI